MRTARAAPLCLTGRGTHGLLQLHRRLLQSYPAALRPRVSLAHLLRTGDANRPTARYPLNRPRKRGNFTVASPPPTTSPPKPLETTNLSPNPAVVLRRVCKPS